LEQAHLSVFKKPLKTQSGFSGVPLRIFKKFQIKGGDKMTAIAWTVLVFIFYLTGLIIIGVFFFRKADSLSDYFIGGRGLNSWVAAISAHAADMSGWLLLSFPGTIYALGTGQVWIAIGLVLGTIFSWMLVAKRLRRYTVTFSYSITLPEFFENRLRDDSHVLRIISAFFIILFFTIYTAAGFTACGTLFSMIFGIDYQITLIIGALIIFIYTFLGGFRALCWIDFFQGLLMLTTVIAVPLIILYLWGGLPEAAAFPANFLNIFSDNSGKPLSAVSIMSGLAWALGYFGMPHILIRFIAVKSERAVSGATFIAGLCVILSLGCAVLMGILGVIFIPNMAEPNTLYIQAIQNIFMQNTSPIPFPMVGAILLCGIFAAIMSTTDSQLLVTASSIMSDLYQGIINQEVPDKILLWLSRISVGAVSVIAYIIAAGRLTGIMDLVSNAWAGFGATFSPLVILSLYWPRLNRSGAVAGIIGGGLTVIIWDYIPLILHSREWITLGQFTELYSLLPGFCISLILIVTISLITAAPSKEIYDEFEIAAAPPMLEE
jgi:sodium/proline symporter